MLHLILHSSFLSNSTGSYCFPIPLIFRAFGNLSSVVHVISYCFPFHASYQNQVIFLGHFLQNDKMTFSFPFLIRSSGRTLLSFICHVISTSLYLVNLTESYQNGVIMRHFFLDLGQIWVWEFRREVHIIQNCDPKRVRKWSHWLLLYLQWQDVR